jgi:cell division protein FtsZ
LDISTFKEKLEIPAYQRKQIDFQNVPAASERLISRFNLNDDDELLGNNKFLHDNVD